eukprot:2158233-Alexandrium_andersonii.AAC.1
MTGPRNCWGWHTEGPLSQKCATRPHPRKRKWPLLTLQLTVTIHAAGQDHFKVTAVLDLNYGSAPRWLAG